MIKTTVCFSDGAINSFKRIFLFKWIFWRALLQSGLSIAAQAICVLGFSRSRNEPRSLLPEFSCACSQSSNVFGHDFSFGHFCYSALHLIIYFEQHLKCSL
jgi:hypothetical protein